MAEVFTIPDYGVTVYGQKDNPKQISPGSGEVQVDGKALTRPVTVKKAVRVTGTGNIAVREENE